MVTFPDELSEREALIMANRTRPKTREQQLKEYQELKDVAEIRANNRKMAALKQNQSPMSDTENFPGREEEKGEARDIAAAKIGLSGKTAEKGAEILEAVEILEEEGKAEAAPVSPLPCPASIPADPSKNQVASLPPRG